MHKIKLDQTLTFLKLTNPSRRKMANLHLNYKPGTPIHITLNVKRVIPGTKYKGICQKNEKESDMSNLF